MNLNIEIKATQKELDKYQPHLTNMLEKYEFRNMNRELKDEIANDIKLLQAIYTENPNRLVEIKYDLLKQVYEKISEEIEGE